MNLLVTYGLVFLAFNFVLAICERLWLRPVIDLGDE